MTEGRIHPEHPQRLCCIRSGSWSSRHAIKVVASLVHSTDSTRDAVPPPNRLRRRQRRRAREICRRCGHNAFLVASMYQTTLNQRYCTSRTSPSALAASSSAAIAPAAAAAPAGDTRRPMSPWPTSTATRGTMRGTPEPCSSRQFVLAQTPRVFGSVLYDSWCCCPCMLSQQAVELRACTNTGRCGALLRHARVVWVDFALLNRKQCWCIRPHLMRHHAQRLYPLPVHVVLPVHRKAAAGRGAQLKPHRGDVRKLGAPALGDVITPVVPAECLPTVQRQG